MIRVMLVDDHPVVREGFRTMLAPEPDIEVVAEAADGEEAVQKAEELAPDVVLMDIRLPGIDGIEATRRIKKARPTTSVILVTMYDSEAYVIEGVRSGAAGYLTKDCSRDLLCHALRAVVSGGALLRSELLRRTVQELVRTARGDPPPGGSFLERLTPREREVFALLAQGLGNAQICAKLCLAEVTVKKHVQSILGKLGVSDRTQAAILGVRLGLAG